MSHKLKPYHVKYITQNSTLISNFSNIVNPLMFSEKTVNIQGKLTKVYWPKLQHIQFVKPEFVGTRCLNVF